MNTREKLGITCAKLMNRIIHRTARGRGTALPGYIARLLAPGIAAELSCMVREKTIVTLGTNGKTTSNTLMCKALEDAGKKVVCDSRSSHYKARLHPGPLLPKNPEVCDYLITQALQHKYGKKVMLQPLPDAAEQRANRYLVRNLVFCPEI